ncbi:hypothetical protein Sinac_1259 [Singulisphaera acidiphila DSM 18658]|uniref:Uncharacterized protein n=1 Tax=Singulisphaera acidiphila (strain ATCC BAA-1392 / DSM 18658 / VKM B-2454 / MOB10) TaxID=886293 RepID=L0D9Y4_SINAD|nr:hypothetical protein Sinac_1259 [Singulisphaera acidiphila DSM 18658]
MLMQRITYQGIEPTFYDLEAFPIAPSFSMTIEPRTS